MGCHFPDKDTQPASLGKAARSFRNDFRLIALPLSLHAPMCYPIDLGQKFGTKAVQQKTMLASPLEGEPMLYSWYPY